MIFQQQNIDRKNDFHQSYKQEKPNLTVRYPIRENVEKHHNKIRNRYLSWSPFLESPEIFSGPKSYRKIPTLLFCEAGL